MATTVDGSISNPFNAVPGTVGGPGQDAAAFAYPTLKSEDPSTRPYISVNYLDMMNVTWVSWAANSTETTLQLWYWNENFATNIWYPLGLQTVPVNGSIMMPLNGVPAAGTKYYLGQWNLNFTREDGRPANGLTLSGFFNCTYDDNKPTTTFGLYGSQVTGSLEVGQKIPESTASSLPQRPSSSANSTAQTSAAASSPVTVGKPSLSKGAIAGIVIGVIAAVVIITLIALSLLRRRMSAQAAEALLEQQRRRIQREERFESEAQQMQLKVQEMDVKSVPQELAREADLAAELPVPAGELP